MLSVSRLFVFRVMTTLVVLAMGSLLFLCPAGDGLTRLSYDLPFVAWPQKTPDDVVLVYLDEKSAADLQQPLDAVWDRSIHTRLLARLTEAGARAVLFDIVFAAETPHDEDFASAMHKQGTVVLSAAMEIDQQMEVAQHIIVAPTDQLRAACAGWGLASLEPDSDHGIRRLFTDLDGYTSSPSAMAQALGKTQADLPTHTAWLNYYDQPYKIPHISLSQALYTDGVPSGFFQAKIVVVGGRSAMSELAIGKDEFAGPWSRFIAPFYPGVEIHAISVLNILRHEWVERLRAGWEWSILVLAALYSGFVLTRLRPLFSLGATLAAILLLTTLAITGLRLGHFWWAWLVPAGAQIPLGLIWSVGVRSWSDARRRAALRRAFSLYLSPHMADRIDADKFDLTPGGKLVEATVMFTDLEGFTALAEELDDPAELSAILIRYYSKTTACILENEGTIIKYMGDAVEAVWNAPVEETDHAFRAVQAACQLREVARFQAHGRDIRTRVGIHTGSAFAGNLGSQFRFDYAVIGDTTNLSSRIEGLNKRFGTEVLLSRPTFDRLGGRFITRPLGTFRVVGKKLPVELHELIAPAGDLLERPWLATFGEGLSAYLLGDLARAGSCFELSRELRGGADGPSEFYLAHLRTIEDQPSLGEWDGVIEFTGK